VLRAPSSLALNPAREGAFAVCAVYLPALNFAKRAGAALSSPRDRSPVAAGAKAPGVVAAGCAGQELAGGAPGELGARGALPHTPNVCDSAFANPN